MKKCIALFVIAVVLLFLYYRSTLEHFQTTTNTTTSCTPNTPVPFITGMIMIWRGDITSIPTGWQLCDGSNGTPDLRGRFVLGSNPSTDTAKGLSANISRAIGGSEQVTLTLAQMPKHSHSYSQGGRYAVCSGCSGHPVGDNPEERQVTKTSGLAGNDQPHDNMPPYYVLAYIMKL